MKTLHIHSIASYLLLSFTAAQAQPLPTAFTYHGQMNVGGQPANGSYDVRFKLFGSPVAANPTFGPAITLNLAVSSGVFATTLDFGNAFDGGDRWLEIAVRPGGSTGDFTTLTPRQQLAPCPYAIYAGSAGSLAGGTYSTPVIFNNPGNSFAGTGTSLTGLNADALASGTVPDTRISASVARLSEVWQVGGNAALSANSFLGTLDSSPVEIRVNNQPVLRLQGNPSGAPNIIGGHGLNSVAPGIKGATIAGGGTADDLGNSAPNSVGGDYGTVGGGIRNQAAAKGATVGGGEYNSAIGFGTVVCGGYNNRSSREASVVAGGFYNSSTNDQATVSGGYKNISGGAGATVPGGLNNLALGQFSFAAGINAQALHDGCFVWSDSNGVEPEFPFQSTGPNEFDIQAAGGVHLGRWTSQYFGAQTRQMLNLWDTAHGIGVQANTTYFRSGSRFSWFRGGSHSDAENNPGSGGAVLMTLDPSGLTVNGTFVSASDRNMKQDFEPIDTHAVLEQVTAMPISKWSYLASRGSRHIGPMAQDFHAAFGVGPDDKHIAMVDADGVALAAIQGLNQKLEAEIQAKNARIAALDQRLSELEKRFSK